MAGKGPILAWYQIKTKERISIVMTHQIRRQRTCVAVATMIYPLITYLPGFRKLKKILVVVAFTCSGLKCNTSRTWTNYRWAATGDLPVCLKILPEGTPYTAPYSHVGGVNVRPCYCRGECSG